jgi:hypothetical protein
VSQFTIGAGNLSVSTPVAGTGGEKSFRGGRLWPTPDEMVAADRTSREHFNQRATGTVSPTGYQNDRLVTDVSGERHHGCNHLCKDLTFDIQLKSLENGEYHFIKPHFLTDRNLSQA